MSEEYKPRFSFEISEELKTRADKVLSNYGLRKAIMTPILVDLLDLIEKHGNMIVGILLDEAAKPSEIIPSMARAERKAK
jgi:hypothetical protein